MNKTHLTPDTATGDAQLAAIRPFGDKSDVASLTGMSKRWVDGQLAHGLPHLRISSRRTKFDLAEVREWFLRTYGTRRLGKAVAK